MIEDLGTIIEDRHDVGVVVLVVVIEGVEDDGEPVPAVGGAEHLARVVAALRRVPEGLGARVGVITEHHVKQSTYSLVVRHNTEILRYAGIERILKLARKLTWQSNGDKSRL